MRVQLPSEGDLISMIATGMPKAGSDTRAFRPGAFGLRVATVRAPTRLALSQCKAVTGPHRPGGWSPTTVPHRGQPASAYIASEPDSGAAGLKARSGARPACRVMPSDGWQFAWSLQCIPARCPLSGNAPGSLLLRPGTASRVNRPRERLPWTAGLGRNLAESSLRGGCQRILQSASRDGSHHVRFWAPATSPPPVFLYPSLRWTADQSAMLSTSAIISLSRLARM